ncbi:polysaccharide deacetylase family protein [Paralcaligenes sp. KSB-10]|uniref:polysaccharide deacetylase family protein n=1 Tax=Paralcaligenes sp. KSB-10 TaxID=2901142 RepID=UPI001E5D1310|nr:polysaccharide deacetylase family protein [Paralcaligenes sp. KSB-10]UHL65848.1 polysaccharide deacetylase family protein [Paralcaligenes sp. KSB-10]
MKQARTVPVLMYHHISPSEGMITTSPDNFERQLAWLSRRGYRSLTSDEFAGHLHGRAVPARSILITFDDGYLDNWVYAYPLLKKYGFSALIFLVTSWVGQGSVRRYLGQDELPQTPAHDECERLIAQGRSDEVILRWSEIEALRAAGTFEFHSHTHTHTRWDKSMPASEKNAHMAQELSLSRETLAEHLGSVSEHFCWPQGYFDADYIRIAREAGFQYLYTTQAFGQNRAGTDPASIYRFAVRNTSGESLGRRIRIAVHPWIGPLFNRWKLWRRARRQRS